MIPIAGKKQRVDWNAIRAEYIAGGIGQRKLAKKHGVSENTLIRRAQEEEWASLREKAKHDAITKAQQKTASMAAESAATAERIRQKLLARLEREIDALPESIGSAARQAMTTKSVEGRNRNNTKTTDKSKEYRIKDLTAAWKDLTDGLIDEGEKDEGVVIVWGK